MRELVEYLVELRGERGMNCADVGRAISERRAVRGERGVDRRRVWDWEQLKTEIGIDDVSDWLTVVGATPEQRLRALALAGGGGHADHPTETEGQAAPPAPRPVAPTSVPTPVPEVTGCEGHDLRPVVGTCLRESCGGPVRALIDDGGAWWAVKCDDCELERELERRRPAVEAVAGAYGRRGAA